jgi:hypothetical protein
VLTDQVARADDPDATVLLRPRPDETTRTERPAERLFTRPVLAAVRPPPPPWTPARAAEAVQAPEAALPAVDLPLAAPPEPEPEFRAAAFEPTLPPEAAEAAEAENWPELPALAAGSPAVQEGPALGAERLSETPSAGPEPVVPAHAVHEPVFDPPSLPPDTPDRLAALPVLNDAAWPPAPAAGAISTPPARGSAPVSGPAPAFEPAAGPDAPRLPLARGAAPWRAAAIVLSLAVVALVLLLLWPRGEPPAARFTATGAPADLAVLADPENGSDTRIAFEMSRRFGAGATPPLRIVYYDELQAVRRSGTAEPWRVVMPLYREEVHFLVRAESPLRFIHQIEGRLINTGPLQGTRAFSARSIYEGVTGAPLPPSRADLLGRDEALPALLDGRIDVMVLVDAAPAAWFAGLPAETAGRLRHLTLAPAHPSTERVTRQYLRAPVEGGQTLGVMAFLIATGAPAADDDAALARIARALCDGLPALQRDGHPKWREVQPGLVLETGWPNAAAAQKALRSCARPNG